jgi:hypothetical protein
MRRYTSIPFSFRLSFCLRFMVILLNKPRDEFWTHLYR